MVYAAKHGFPKGCSRFTKPLRFLDSVINELHEEKAEDVFHLDLIRPFSFVGYRSLMIFLDFLNASKTWNAQPSTDCLEQLHAVGACYRLIHPTYK